MIEKMGDPVEATEARETELGRSLRGRANDRDPVATSYPRDPVTSAELMAVADAFDHQHRTLELSREYAEKLAASMAEQCAAALREHAEKQDRMRLVIRLMRFYALNPVILPEQDEVIAFLRAYIDDGKYLPVPWPTELPTAAKFLSDAGYFNLNGVAHRAHAIKE